MLFCCCSLLMKKIDLCCIYMLRNTFFKRFRFGRCNNWCNNETISCSEVKRPKFLIIICSHSDSSIILGFSQYSWFSVNFVTHWRMFVIWDTYMCGHSYLCHILALLVVAYSQKGNKILLCCWNSFNKIEFQITEWCSYTQFD